MFMLRRTYRRKEENFVVLESELQQTFKPISPRAEFVRDLREQLLLQLGDAVQRSTELPSRRLVFAAATFISGVVILVIGIRTVMTLLALLAMLQRIRQQSM